LPEAVDGKSKFPENAEPKYRQWYNEKRKGEGERRKKKKGYATPRALVFWGREDNEGG